MRVSLFSCLFLITILVVVSLPTGLMPCYAEENDLQPEQADRRHTSTDRAAIIEHMQERSRQLNEDMNAGRIPVPDTGEHEQQGKAAQGVLDSSGDSRESRGDAMLTAAEGGEITPVDAGAGAVTEGGGIAPAQDGGQGLILWYDFTKEPAGYSVDDLSGNGYTAQLMGPVWAAGVGLYFDGNDDFIRVKGGEKIHSEKGLTVMGEILPCSFDKKTWQNLVWKGDQPTYAIKSDNREFSIWLNSQAYLHATSTPDDWIGRGQIYVNTRGGSVTRKRAFAFVIDSTEGAMKIFLDGDLAASGKYSTAGIRRTRGDLKIGGGTPDVSDAYFHGYIRWLRIFGRVLSAEEIRETVRHSESDAASPWRDPYRLSDVVVPGGLAEIIPIRDNVSFARMGRDMLEPGVVIQDGWLTLPDRDHPTEIVYRHDGSTLGFSGLATILDCLNYCGEKGMVAQRIYGDGRLLWDGGKIGHKQPAKSFSVDLTGVREIRLVTTDGGDDVDEDWAAWLNLTLTTGDKGKNVSASGPPVLSDTGAAGQTGKIDKVCALTEQPSGSAVSAVKTFSLFTDQIYVWFSFSGMEPGTIMKGVFLDEGRRTVLQEFPVVITRPEGTAGFAIRRPIDGWSPGQYRVDLKSGKTALGSVGFQITR